MNKFKMMEKETYWRLRDEYTKQKLKIESKKYNFFKKKINKDSEKSYNLMIYKALINQLIKSFIIFIILYSLDYLGKILIDFNVFSNIKLIGKKYLDLSIDMNFFTSTLIGGVGIAGVFLGLYYSNMSSIFSDKYSNTSKEMRNLFTNELITNKNIDYVIRYIIISLIVLIFNSIGLSPWYISIIIMLILTVKVIITFSILGKRTYEFSDTYFISTPIYSGILWNIKNALVGGYKWNEKNFQNHYKKECSINFNILTQINLYNLEDKNIKTKSMINFMYMNLSLLCEYIANKKYIPHNSYWFREKYQHKMWHESSDNEISIAIATGTSIKPIIIKDYYWFEDEILNMNNACLDKFIQENNIDAILEYIDTFIKSIELWIYSCDEKKCIEVLKDLDYKILSYIENSETDELKRLALVDRITLMYSEYIVSINKLLSQYDTFSHIDYSDNKLYDLESILKLGNPIMNNSEIVSLFDSISKEIKIENEKITPDWYIKQYIAKVYYNKLISINNILINLYKECIYEKACKYIDKNQYKISVMYLSRENELFNKLDRTFNYIDKLEKILINYKIRENDNWAENNISRNKQKIYDVHKTIPKKWIKCSVVFIEGNYTKMSDYPDFLGFCYNNIVEYLIITLENNDFDSFKIGYEKLLPLCLMYQDYIKVDLAKKGNNDSFAAINVIISPIIEFCEISGYATIIGELTNNNKWSDYINLCLESQMKYIVNDESNSFENFIYMVKLKKSMPIGIYNRDLIRQNWKQRFNSSIINNKLINFKNTGHFGQSRLDTDNKLLINIFSVYNSKVQLNIDAYEVYIVRYINKHLCEEKKIKFRWDN